VAHKRAFQQGDRSRNGGVWTLTEFRR